MGNTAIMDAGDASMEALRSVLLRLVKDGTIL